MSFFQHAVTEGFALYRGYGAIDEKYSALSILNGVVNDFVSRAKSNPQFVERFLFDFDDDTGCLVSMLPRLGTVLPADPTSQGPIDFAGNRNNAYFAISGSDRDTDITCADRTG